MFNNKELVKLMLERKLINIESHVYENTSNLSVNKKYAKVLNNGYLWMTELRVIVISIFSIFFFLQQTYIY